MKFYYIDTKEKIKSAFINKRGEMIMALKNFNGDEEEAVEVYHEVRMEIEKLITSLNEFANEYGLKEKIVIDKKGGSV